MRYLSVPKKYESEIKRLIPYEIMDKADDGTTVTFACNTYQGGKWRAFVKHIETIIKTMEALE